jgi:hypothetical protein
MAPLSTWLRAHPEMFRGSATIIADCLAEETSRGAEVRAAVADQLADAIIEAGIVDLELPDQAAIAAEFDADIGVFTDARMLVGRRRRAAAARAKVGR